jgi:hypothetical protein
MPSFRTPSISSILISGDGQEPRQGQTTYLSTSRFEIGQEQPKTAVIAQRAAQGHLRFLG